MSQQISKKIKLDFRSPLTKLGYKTIKELETESGILASARDEIFGCVFGRDSLITAHILLKTYEASGDEYLLGLVRKILGGLADLQGKSINIESGEEPGKCIHEFRPMNHERLTKDAVPAWHVYPDGAMRNYDTIDATPLFLILSHEYYEITRDEAFIAAFLPNVRDAIQWILKYGDHNRDGFFDYRFHPNRTSGGLSTQNWMDSTESLFYEPDPRGGTEKNGRPLYPIAPVEVQAYAFAALRRWATYFKSSDPKLSRQLLGRASRLKKRFNQKFVLLDLHLAFALDGRGKPLTAARSSMGHILWTAAPKEARKPAECILDSALIPVLVERLLSKDLFEPRAGIRTLSSDSPHFDPQSYHNGSIWPHDTAICIEGLENFGYYDEAAKVRDALLKAYKHFRTPLELFAYEKGAYMEYISPGGQSACLKQAWSAAALLKESILSK